MPSAQQQAQPGAAFGVGFALQPQSTTFSGGLFQQQPQPQPQPQPQLQQQMMMMQQPSPQQVQFESVINSMLAAYEEKSPYCRFNFMFYNVLDAGVNPQDVIRQLRTQHPYVHDVMWTQALQKNPDPTRLVPVPARSVADLTTRVEAQQQATQTYQRALQEVEKNLENIRRHHDVDTVTKIEKLRQRNMELSFRVLGVMKRLEVLRQRGIPIGGTDIEVRDHLQAIQRELHKPNQYRGRLNELLPQLNFYTQYSAPLPNANAIDDESLASISKFLEQQQQGIDSLMSVCQRDSKDIQTVITNLKGVVNVPPPPTGPGSSVTANGAAASLSGLRL